MNDHSNNPPQLPAAESNNFNSIHSSLSDEVLAASGLAKVYAFVRSESGPNAARAKRARAKAVSEGNGQVNIVVPLAAHRAIKEMARDLQAGRSIKEALLSLLANEVTATDPGAVVRLLPAKRALELDSLHAKVTSLSGWRLILARAIGFI